MMSAPDSSQSLTICTSSAEETAQVGYRLGAAAQPGQVIALQGPLGGGKTQMVKGIARGMGIPDPVTSPTFVLVNEYAGEQGRLIHIDTYRLGVETSSGTTSVMLDAATFGLEDILADAEADFDGSSRSVVVIEWAERIKNLLPPDHLQITFHTFAEQPQCRSLELLAHGERSLALLQRIQV